MIKSHYIFLSVFFVLLIYLGEMKAHGLPQNSIQSIDTVIKTNPKTEVKVMAPNDTTTKNKHTKVKATSPTINTQHIDTKAKPSVDSTKNPIKPNSKSKTISSKDTVSKNIPKIQNLPKKATMIANPPQANSTFSKSAYSSLIAVVDANFTEQLVTQPYSLKVEFVAKPGYSFKKPKMLIVLTNNQKKIRSYSSVEFATPLVLDSIKDKKSNTEYPVGTSDPLPLSNDLKDSIHVYLLSDTGVSGFYNQTSSVTEKFTTGGKSTIKIRAKGFVCADGNTEIFINDGKDEWNITGQFMGNDFLNGQVLKVASDGSNETLTYTAEITDQPQGFPSVVSTSNSLIFQLKLTQESSTSIVSDTITIILKK